MAILEVAAQQANTFSSTAVDSLALAFPNPVTSGNFLIVTGGGWKATGYTDFAVTDTLGTTYTVVLGPGVSWASGTGKHFIAYGFAPSTGANTVTVNPTGGNGTIVFAVDEFTGVHATPLDVDGLSSTGTSTTCTDGITTGVDGALVVGHLLVATSMPGPVIQGGFTSLYIKAANDGHPGGAAFKVCGAPGAQTFGWTVSTSRGFSAMTLSFAPVVGAGQSQVLSGPSIITETVFPILPAFTAPLGLVTEDDVLFDVTPAGGAALGVSSWEERWIAADGLLGVTADHTWTRLASGARSFIQTNQFAFIGTGFGAELTRCETPLSSESYRVRVPLAGWALNTANDISLGVIVRKDETSALTAYAVFMSQTATAQLIRLARYLAGSVVQLGSVAMVAQENDILEVTVFQLAPPTTRLIVRVANTLYLDVLDTLIPSGRYVGTIGYLQGDTANLRLGTLTARNVGQRVPVPLLTAGMAGVI